MERRRLSAFRRKCNRLIAGVHFRVMNPAGVALFVFVASINTLPQQQVVLPPRPPVASPDHAPPHPLKPRDPEARFDTPAVALARVIGSLARGVLRDHGH
jgi:hypothetical protein